MEGYLINCPTAAKPRHKKWKKLYFKLDDISAKLHVFKDMSQAEHKGTMMMSSCEVYTPVPGAENYGVDVTEVPYCFVVQEALGFDDKVLYLGAENEASKKKWVHAINTVSKNGPREAKFAKSMADNDYTFEARVTDFRVHQKGYVEYKIRCYCRVLSRHAAKHLTKEWDVWHRFSSFADLDSGLRKEIAEVQSISFLPRKREAFRGLLGNKLEVEFLEKRRVGLDSYITQVCKIPSAVDFFKHHSNARLKAFFEFEYQSKTIDDSEYDNQKKRAERRAKSSGSDTRDTRSSSKASKPERQNRHRDGERRRHKDNDDSSGSTRHRRSERESKHRQKHRDSDRRSERSSHRDSHIQKSSTRHEDRKKERRGRERHASPPPPPMTTPPPKPSNTAPAPSIEPVMKSKPKPVPPPVKSAPKLPAAPAGRSDLMSAIRLGGVKLKKTETNDRSGVAGAVSQSSSTSTATRDAGFGNANASGVGGGISAALEAAMQSRGGRFADDESDSGDEWK